MYTLKEVSDKYTSSIRVSNISYTYLIQLRPHDDSIFGRHTHVCCTTELHPPERKRVKPYHPDTTSGYHATNTSALFLRELNPTA